MGNDVGSPVPPSNQQAAPYGSVRNTWSLGRPVIATTDGNDTTPAVTEEFVAEIMIDHPAQITGIAIFNGSAVAGNVQAVLYDSGGRKVGNTASTAQAGTDALQKIALTAPVRVPPGTYYIGVQCNNVGARLNTHTLGVGGTVKKTAQTYGTFVNFTPPTAFVANVGIMGTLY